MLEGREGSAEKSVVQPLFLVIGKCVVLCAQKALETFCCYNLYSYFCACKCTFFVEELLKFVKKILDIVVS